MGLALKDLIKNPASLRASLGQSQCCSHCGVILHEAITGKRHTPGGISCSDCYFDQLGEGVEQHPITSGQPPRR
jgi:hypothetical protein